MTLTLVSSHKPAVVLRFKGNTRSSSSNINTMKYFKMICFRISSLLPGIA